MAEAQYLTAGFVPFGGGDSFKLPSHNQNIIPVFSSELFLNEARTREEGRQIYDTREIVTYMIGGDSKSMPVERVTEQVKRRFPEQYAAFKRGEEVAQSGTPLEMWPWLNTPQVRHLKYLNIFSVEQLAEASDGVIGNIGMGGRTLVKQAKAWLEAAQTGSAPVKTIEENESLKAENARLQAQMDEMAVKFEAMERRVASIANAPASDSRLGHDGFEVERSNPAVLGVVNGVEIPRDWRSMPYQKQKSLAAQFSMAAIVTKEDTIAALEEAERTLKA
jgi:hypothetical protein